MESRPSIIRTYGDTEDTEQVAGPFQLAGDVLSGEDVLQVVHGVPETQQADTRQTSADGE